jgi:hypothetical protein
MSLSQGNIPLASLWVAEIVADRMDR